MKGEKKNEEQRRKKGAGKESRKWKSEKLKSIKQPGDIGGYYTLHTAW